MKVSLFTFLILASFIFTGSTAFAAGGACPANATATGNNCYFIAANGSDSNSGTSESSPWLHAPGMPACSGICATVQTSFGGVGSTVAGVGLIFRGGDTWHEGNSSLSPYTGGTINIIWSGSPTNCAYEGDMSGCFYIGVDTTWYNSSVCGSSWCRPKFNGDNPLSTTLVSSCAFQTGSQNQLIVLSQNENSYIDFDSFEILGLCSQDTTGGGSNGGEDVMVMDDGTYKGVGGAGLTFKNNIYMHGWTVTTATQSNAGVNCTVMGGGGTEAYNGIVIDGSDSDPGVCNWGIFPHIYHMKDSMIRYATQGVGTCHDIHDNIWDHIVTPYVLTHNNILECNDEDQGSTPNVFYNNIVRHSNSNVDIWFCPNTTPEYWFNNLMYDTEGEGWSIAGTTQYPECTNSGGQFMFNNTFVDGNTGGWNAPCHLGGSNISGGQYLTVLNQHMINTTWDGAGCTGGASSVTNISMTDAVATTQGYTTGSSGTYLSNTCANDSTAPCAPKSNSNATVAAGENLQSYCTQLATYGSEYAIGTEAANACKYGTTDGCSYNTTTHTMNCPGSVPLSRPQSAAWDVGAYQLNGTPPPNITPPSIPAGLTAAAATSSQIDLSWSASTDTDGVVAGYYIYRNSIQVGKSTTTSYADTGLTASTLYTYTVSAYDTVGTNSPPSSSASATTFAQSTGGGSPGQLFETVSANSNGSGVITLNLTLPTNQGELMVVGVVTALNGSAPSITDNKGSTYTKLWQLTGLHGHYSESLYYLANAPAGISTITVTEGTGDSLGGAVAEHYAGMLASNVLDGASAPGSTGSANPWSSGQITTSQASDVLIGQDFAWVSGGANPCSIAASGNWTQDSDVSGIDGGNGGAMSISHHNVSAVQTNIANTGTNPTGTCMDHAGIAAFKMAASASVIYGDVNGDGQVTVFDAFTVAQYAVGLVTFTPAQMQASEVSSTTETSPSVYDAFLIAEYAVGLITKFPVQS